VDLAKGWKWKATAHPTCPHYSEGTVASFQVPREGNPRINCQLQALLWFQVKTIAVVQGQTVNEPSRIEFYRKEGEGYALVLTGDTVTQPNGEEIWGGMALPVGACKIRAQSRQGMPTTWTEEEFGVAPGIELTKTITVTRQMPQWPPPGP